MNTDFKRGLMVGLGVLVAIVLIGWLMKILLWRMSKTGSSLTDIS